MMGHSSDQAIEAERRVETDLEILKRAIVNLQVCLNNIDDRLKAIEAHHAKHHQG